MRVAVIGAGVIGVTTAYELGADGHEVTVFERRGTVAAESSFANAGLVAPGYVSPWSAPGMPGKVLSHLFSKHAPVRFGGAPDLATIGWLWRWWRACKPATYRANRARMHRLAHFSRERLHELTARLHLDFERADGFLVLLRSAKDLAMAEPGIRALAELGVAPQVLDAAGCRRIEPGLNPETELHAGVYSKDDEVGNCREFSHLLRKEAARIGVRFRFEMQVERIVAGSRPGLVVARTPGDPRDAAAGSRADVSGWTTTEPEEEIDGEVGFDAVVVCAAMGSEKLLRPLGIRLPLQPVYGYSVTAPLRHDDQHLHREPRAALMDERYKVAISRFGNRVRVAGSAEIGGRLDRQSEAAQRTLDKVLDDWFPGVTQRGQAQRWKGARPMLPDGPPVLGPSGAEGVWLNLGHGGSGWALSCGSAKLVADSVAGRTNPIGIDGLGIERLWRRGGK
ncbi:MAG: FAD-dependent oxidoreductase [Burkholderiales bacterium]|nr:FAD-dependent oxidoreductase [Burkholderiales bacterium]